MYLIKTKNDALSKDLEGSLIEYLKKEKIDFVLEKNLSKQKAQPIKAILAIGDDDLILETFRQYCKESWPVLGISSSSSFLAEAEAFNFKKMVNAIEKNQFDIFRRTRIAALFNNKKTLPALNEIGIFPEKSASLLRYTLVLDGDVFWKDTSDGIIISTPTGSTGYSFSAGGPIIWREPSVLTITPIASMDKAHTPVVVSDSVKIELTHIQSGSPVVVSIDGKIRQHLSGDVVEVSKSEKPACFIRFSKELALAEKFKRRAVKAVSEKIAKMPPSSKLIYKILSQQGELTQKEIISESFLPARTVRHALELMLREKLIVKKPYLNDARQMVYSL